MSRLTITPDDRPGQPDFISENATEIAARLAPLAVSFERWQSPVAIGPDDAPDAILAAYRPHLDALMGQSLMGQSLMGESGAGSADVIKLTPDHPQAAALRAKFLQEHRHTEPEIRFFVAGSGNFILHVNGFVYDVKCTEGDLIGVPAGIPHWFDAGPAPDFTALRVFTDTTGWVPHFTGSDISTRFPASE